MISCGVDIVEMDTMRVTYMRQGERLLERLLTKHEQAEWSRLRQPEMQVAYLAKRFAAKEALLKAIKTGLSQGFSWQQIEVVKAESGAVSFKLSPDFYANLVKVASLSDYSSDKNLEIALSLSDSLHYAIAQVFIMW